MNDIIQLYLRELRLHQFKGASIITTAHIYNMSLKQAQIYMSFLNKGKLHFKLCGAVLLPVKDTDGMPS